MSSSSSMSLMIPCGPVADPDHLLGLDAGGAAGLLGGGLEPLLRLLARLLDHRLADADPFEIVGRVDHGEHHHARAGAGRAPGGEMDRPGAFGRLVDHHHEFRPVAGLVGSALAAHGIALLHRPRCCPAARSQEQAAGPYQHRRLS